MSPQGNFDQHFVNLQVDGAWEWLEMSLQGTKGKFAVFAHHCAVIRGISRRLQAAGVVGLPNKTNI